MKTYLATDYICRACENKIVVQDFLGRPANLFIGCAYCSNKMCPNHEQTLLTSSTGYPGWALYLPAERPTFAALD